MEARLSFLAASNIQASNQNCILISSSSKLLIFHLLIYLVGPVLNCRHQTQLVAHGGDGIESEDKRSIRVRTMVLPPNEGRRKEATRGATRLRDDCGKTTVGKERVRRATNTDMIVVSRFISKGSLLGGFIEGIVGVEMEEETRGDRGLVMTKVPVGVGGKVAHFGVRTEIFTDLPVRGRVKSKNVTVRFACALERFCLTPSSTPTQLDRPRSALCCEAQSCTQITNKMSNDAENPKGNKAQESRDSINPSAEIPAKWCDIIFQQVSVYGIAAGYCISASLLSIINKWAVMKFPYPGALTALQYFTSTAGVLLCGWFKLLEHDPLDLMTMWRFLPAAAIFYLSLFTNSELLLHANVDTFIVFRSAVPIFVAIGEATYLHQPWPSIRTWISLTTIFGGSVLYVLTDYQFTLTAYSWAMAYLISMSVDFVYIKHVVMTIGLNTWGLVLYNNLEALLLFPLELLIMGELKKIKHEISEESDWYSLAVVFPVGLSCLFGLAISFFGFSCRRAISATGFTVLGIVNKLLTVVINLIIWDKHSSVLGTVGLLICMAGGVMYQQSTSNKPKALTEAKAQESEEEQQKLLEMQSDPEDRVTLKEVGDSGESK
ncbi:hypothetical protein NE237_007178 [Protea cynaroides]|uniref:Sugar phosphate transporter domain-containing protein n=1 Tax=Protea cynaroides TaxID=273540 RepID=A0A9Q0KPL4_9MAGN|nr:hypothetical protein NE237_007178 [Protea cynaroides]